MNRLSAQLGALSALGLDGSKVIDVRGLRDVSDEVMEGTRPRIMSAAFYAALTTHERALLGMRNALYGLPTEELVDWLRAEIDGRSAIEIGAGHGALAAALGIPATDSWLQAEPEIALVYAATGQPPITYGEDVVRRDAADAVAHYRPQVVIASWVTHLYRAERHAAGGNMFGVAEEAIIDACDSYIFIGNEHVHRDKSIWSRPHRILYPDWLYSRAHNGSREFIAVWEESWSKRDE